MLTCVRRQISICVPSSITRFVGHVMKATHGKANPAQVNELLKQKLKG